MIVKNERANLERCLTAVAPYISCWVIGDTGSNDGTPEFVRSFFAQRNLPGELHTYPFVDFAQARNEALNRARASSLTFDYLLLVDADMELQVHDPSFSWGLTSAAYAVRQRNDLTYRNIRLLRRNAPASYRGVTHEYLAVHTGETSNMNEISLLDHPTGSNRIDKYRRDLRLLTAALPAERDPVMIARYMFYLANTLRDCGQREAALSMYLRRANYGHWRQEVFVSLLSAARLKQALGHDVEEVISAYAAAAASCPSRAEALHGAARFCRIQGLYERGYSYALQALAAERAEDALFPEDWVYDFGSRDELAVCAYWTGRYAICREACDHLIGDGRLPAQHRTRVLHNRNAAAAKIAEIGPELSTHDDLARGAVTA